MKTDRSNEDSLVETIHGDGDPPRVHNSDQKISYSLRDFISPLNPSRGGNLDAIEAMPFIDEPSLSEDEQPEAVLNNAACRLRRWRAASRKLRRPRIIDNLSKSADKDGNVRDGYQGHTDLADRLASMAVVNNMSASAGELLSLAPPPPAATAPSSPGSLFSPHLLDQSSVDYFGSSPECCGDPLGLESVAGAPMPPPGPRYKLATERHVKVCCFQHTRTVVDKILATKFLRRWESHLLRLEEHHIVAKAPSGLLEKPLSYGSMLEVFRITRWDSARKYCLRIVMSNGSLLLQTSDAYTRDQWYYSICWRRNMIRYRNVLRKSDRKEVVIKELKCMVDFVLTSPLQDETITQTPLDIIADLLEEEQESPDWCDWADSITNAVAPLLSERSISERLCGPLYHLCKTRPRAAPLPALAPLVRRVLTRNVDFGKGPYSRKLVKSYVRAMSFHNSGNALVRRFVEILHGDRATSPHPRAGPNLASVALTALDIHFKDYPLPHQCDEMEDNVMCFADVLEHMSKYEDWLVTVGSLMQPVPLCENVLACPRVAVKLQRVLTSLAQDKRCIAHSCVLWAAGMREEPPFWLKSCGPAHPVMCLPHDELCQLWGGMLDMLLSCCNKSKKFLKEMSNQMSDFLVVALTEHPAALGALTLMLEWEVHTDDQMQMEIIATLQGTNLGRQYYNDLCERQEHLQKLQSEGGPSRLALPVRATDADVAALLEGGALGNLECLSLAFTNVTGACAQHLIKLPALRYLNLWATKFDDNGLALISDHLTRLQVLNLCETPVTDKGIEALAGLKNLRQLNLNSTKITGEVFENLRAQLPNLETYDIRYTEAW